MPGEKHLKKLKAQSELLKYIDENEICYEKALEVLKKHFTRTQIKTLYPGHNPGGLY